MFQLTQFLHNTVFFRNQNARYAGTRCNSMNNLSSYSGLVDAKIRASDKDLPLIIVRKWALITD